MFKQKKKRSREFKTSDKVIDFEQAREERRRRRREVSLKKRAKDQKSASEELSERKVNKRNRKRLIYLAIVLSIIVVIGVSIFNVFSLQKEYKEIVAQNEELQKNKKTLVEELANVNNPEYIEQQARQQLKMVMPGEILYILPALGTSNAAIKQEAATQLLPAGEGGD